jgi:hypothetical protein
VEQLPPPPPPPQAHLAVDHAEMGLHQEQTQQPLPPPQAASSGCLHDEADAEMDLELCILRTLEADHESTSSDEAEMMELDEPERSHFRASERKVLHDKARAATSQYYRALALKNMHPFAVNPPRNRAACA